MRVKQALNQDLARSDYRDSATIATLSHHEIIGPRLLARLRTPRSGTALRRVLADVQIAPTWASDSLFAEMALDDALQFQSTLINTPRDGQKRLWRTDPDLAFEVFEQDLSQGGKASEGLAGPAVRTAAERAVPILLKFITLPGNEKVAADIGQALRIVPEPTVVETQISPAFDINPAPERNPHLETAIMEGGTHKRSIMLALEACAFFEIPEPEARTLIRTTAEKITALWRDEFRRVGVTGDQARAYEAAFQHAEADLALAL